MERRQLKVGHQHQQPMEQQQRLPPKEEQLHLEKLQPLQQSTEQRQEPLQESPRWREKAPLLHQQLEGHPLPNRQEGKKLMPKGYWNPCQSLWTGLRWRRSSPASWR